MTAQSMEGRVCLITGANTGIGKETALELARRGATLVLACRSKERTQAVLDELDAIERPSGSAATTHFLALDLASLDSVRECASEFLALDLPLHVLVNNAGLAGHRGLTDDGFELTFGVNHLGHFLLTVLLADKLIESAPSRVVNVASQAHYGAKNGIDFDAVRETTKSRTGYPEYEVSKLANVLFSAELSRRLGERGVSTYSLHPGVIASDVWRRVPWPFRSLIKLFMKSTEEGAATSIHCASDEAAGNETGLYYDDCKVKDPAERANDNALAATLWKRSADWTGADLSG